MFQELKKERASDQAAAAIRDHILTGGLAPGERLPPERELAAQLGVNRTTVREALRSLEQLGLVDIRHGGGATVLDHTRAGLAVLPYLLTLGGKLDPALLDNFLEVRRVIGVAIARLAAERADDEDLRRLREVLARLDAALDGDDGPLSATALGTLDLQFFLALAHAGKNRVFRFMLHATRSISGSVPDIFATLFRDGERVRRTHRRVLEAIEAHDVKRAGDLIEAYLSSPIG